MLRGSVWYGTDDLARGQFRVFTEVGDTIRLSPDDRRRALALSEREWDDWVAFLRDGSRPTEPELPEMLRRLGSATFRLAVVAEQQAVLA
jgi:hypothetical protein